MHRIEIIITVTSIKWEWFCRCTIRWIVCGAVFVLSALERSHCARAHARVRIAVLASNAFTLIQYFWSMENLLSIFDPSFGQHRFYLKYETVDVNSEIIDFFSWFGTSATVNSICVWISVLTNVPYSPSILGFSFFKLNFRLQHHSARYLRLVTPNWIDVDLQIDNSVLR